MTTALDVSIAWPTGDLRAYEKAVHAYPLVSEEEERNLAERYRQQHDLTAAWHLVTSHLRFVLKLARGYQGYGLPEADLIQEGNVGLMKAVKRFDPAYGVRLAAYAVHHIRAEIHEYILKNWRIVKFATTKARRKLFYRLRSAKKNLEWLTQDEAAEIAQALGVGEHDVKEMDVRLYSNDAGFEKIGADEESDWAPEEYLGDERFEPSALVAETEWKNASMGRLLSAVENLDERSRDIVKSRWFGDERATLADLGEKYGVSTERIRQLEQGAMKKIREALKDLQQDLAA